jgi:hypothetical protein
MLGFFFNTDDKTDSDLTALMNNLEEREMQLQSDLALVQDNIRTIRAEQKRRFKEKFA